ncbi:hypothetical protein OUZ56_009569 [Daphnia magna]|uniref:Uncharacterized protein n=1 Tax=Daphnia magna TaxID=35525 RepID=A0ABR0AGD0_9CRUS|nr:hypothetical protein OUZ56_009569 [Daphnia magna]
MPEATRRSYKSLYLTQPVLQLPNQGREAKPSPLLETHLKDVEESFRFTESGIDNLEALHNEKVEMKSSMQKRITKI